MANRTLMDYAREADESGKAGKIVEMMAQVNEIMDDMVVLPSNMTEGHKAIIRTGYSDATWRIINKGVIPSKSSSKQIMFTPGMLEKLGSVDEEIVKLYDDKAGFRVNENVAHIQRMGEQLAHAVFYGNQNTDPEQITGLSYYLSDPTAESGKNLINGGGTGDDNTSLWLVVWGENTVHGFFPKNTAAGIEHNDLGLELVDDGTGTGAKFRAWMDQFKAKLGLAPKDWRYMVRICNLDVSALATAGDATGDTSANLLKLMVKAKNLVPSLRAGKAAWYCNQDVKTALDNKALSKSNLQLTIKDLADGFTETRFLGIPVRRCDALVNDEAKITFA